MTNQEKMIAFLKEYLKTFESVLNDEKEKLKQFITFEVDLINDAIKVQQSNEMRIANIEKKRAVLQNELGYANMTFQEIIDTFDDKVEMEDLYKKISFTVNEVKFYNNKAMEIARSQLELYECVKDNNTQTIQVVNNKEKQETTIIDEKI